MVIVFSIICAGTILLNHLTSNRKLRSITKDSVAILNRFMSTRFIAPEPIELGAKNEELGERGPPLGRRPANRSPELIKQRHEDEKYRNAIEGKFGQAKRRFSLGRIMAKLSDTAESSIAITFLVMNLVYMLIFYIISNSSFCWELVLGSQSHKRRLKEY